MQNENVNKNDNEEDEANKSKQKRRSRPADRRPLGHTHTHRERHTDTNTDACLLGRSAPAKSQLRLLADGQSRERNGQRSRQKDRAQATTQRQELKIHPRGPREPTAADRADPGRRTKG